VFARPRDSGGNILILNSQLGEASPHLIGAALLQRAQNDARPVGAYVKILHPGEAGDHFFGKSDLIFCGLFRKHGYLFKENRDTRKSYHILGDFEGRKDMNSHMPMVEACRRMYAVFEPILLHVSNQDFSAAEIAQVLAAWRAPKV